MSAVTDATTVGIVARAFLMPAAYLVYCTCTVSIVPLNANGALS
jgi:hypothetical protein